MSAPFTRAVVQGLRSREIPAPVIAEIVTLVAARYGDHPASLCHKLLSRHAHRAGRKRKSLEYKRKIAVAMVWAKFNGRSDKAVASAAQQYGVLQSEIVRAFSKHDRAMTDLIEEVEKSPGNFLGDFPREPKAKA